MRVPFRNPIRRLSQLVADRAIFGATTGRRVEVIPAEIDFYSGSGSEVLPGRIETDPAGTAIWMQAPSPNASTTFDDRAGVSIQQSGPLPPAGGATARVWRLSGDKFTFEGLNSLGGVRQLLVDFWNNAAELVGFSTVELHGAQLHTTGQTQLDGGALFGGVGRVLLGEDFGSFSGTTDANGDVTITHALGSAPTTVLITPGNPFFFYRVLVASRTATQFKVRCASTAGAVFGAGQAITLDWQALL